MKMKTSASTPDAYVNGLRGWRHELVVSLRSAVRAAARFEETLKWGHLVYLSNGPVLLIRAEPKRVLFGFWRGQRLTEIEPRLRGGGKYEMATLELKEGESITPAKARKLAREAATLNRDLGDPTLAAKPKSNPKAKARVPSRRVPG